MVQTIEPAAWARRGGGAQAVGYLRIVAAAAALIHSWATAAEGRRRTERALRALDRTSWQVTPHVAVPDGGHVDHLVVGHGRVYVLVSKVWHGVVTVDHKGATITPEDDPAAAWTAHGQHRSLPPAAGAVVRALSVATRAPRPAPRPVVVIWAPFPERVAVSGGTTYVAGDHLAEWLSAQPRPPDRQGLDGSSAGAASSDVPPAPSPLVTASATL